MTDGGETPADQAVAVVSVADRLHGKPRHRGRLHQTWVYVSIPAGVILVLHARGTAGQFAAAVFATAFTCMYLSSAGHHRGAWRLGGIRSIQRIDHSMIYVMIAASYTPVALIALDGWLRWIVLGIEWGGAALGITLKLTRFDTVRAFGAFLYSFLSALALFIIPPLLERLTPTEAQLGLVGLGLSAVGSLVLARKRPDPWPASFGYHEIWHVFVVVATACHYVMVYLITGSPNR